MRVPWFNWRVSGQRDEVARVACAPRERTEDDIALALRLIPLYHVLLQVNDPHEPMRLWWPLEWRTRLTVTLGAERALRVLREASEHGVAVLAVCPRELAEHYRDELARQSLPCDIEPA